MVGDFLSCCARAASGRAAADPAIPVMNSRRRIAFPRLGTTPNLAFNSGNQNRNSRPAIWGAMVCLRSSNPAPHMSARGHSRRFKREVGMTASPQ